MSEYGMNARQFQRCDSINSDDEHIYFTISDLNATNHYQKQSDIVQIKQSASEWSTQKNACWNDYWRWCDLYAYYYLYLSLHTTAK